MRVGELKEAWLLKKRWPRYRVLPSTPERRLWWATLRQAAKDVRRGIEPEKTDALEFLESTGLWLLQTLFFIKPEESQKEIIGL